MCMYVWGRGISPKFKNSEDGTLLSSSSHHHPPSLIKDAGAMTHPHTPHTTYNTVHTVYCALDWSIELDWYDVCTGLVY